MNPSYNPVLAPYDLTRGGTTYTWHGRTDVKQLALYGEDQITAGHWLINAGIRGDIYNGLAIQRVAEPRLGVAYNVPRQEQCCARRTHARRRRRSMRISCFRARAAMTRCSTRSSAHLGPCNPAPFNPGFRNEFHAGVQQGVGHHFVLDGEYIWKYTHNAFDFSVLGATPITFPIEWHNSKIPGWTLSGTLTPVKGLSARLTMSSVAARFFNPQIGGVGATVGVPGGFPSASTTTRSSTRRRILSTRLPFRKSLYYSFNWRYDSGIVAGSVPCYGTHGPE